MNTVKISRKQAQPILSQSFPDYTGRKITVRFTETVGFYNLNWDGGSKNEFVAIAADGRHEELTVAAPWNEPREGRRVAIPQDVLIVEHTYFCGQDAGITIYAHPCHAPRWIA